LLAIFDNHLSAFKLEKRSIWHSVLRRGDGREKREDRVRKEARVEKVGGGQEKTQAGRGSLLLTDIGRHRGRTTPRSASTLAEIRVRKAATKPRSMKVGSMVRPQARHVVFSRLKLRELPVTSNLFPTSGLAVSDSMLADATLHRQSNARSRKYRRFPVQTAPRLTGIGLENMLPHAAAASDDRCQLAPSPQSHVTCSPGKETGLNPLRPAAIPRLCIDMTPCGAQGSRPSRMYHSGSSIVMVAMANCAGLSKSRSDVSIPTANGLHIGTRRSIGPVPPANNSGQPRAMATLGSEPRTCHSGLKNERR